MGYTRNVLGFFQKKSIYSRMGLHSDDLRSILLVALKDMEFVYDFSRCLNVVAMQNPMSTLNMTPHFIISYKGSQAY